jgi:glucose/mannose-6-phosphate isomerase
MNLDNQNAIHNKDPQDALGTIANSIEQLTWEAHIQNTPDSNFSPLNVVLAGMGGSALGGLFAKDWLNLPVPFEVVRDYRLPAFVNEKTLVIVSSFSGNTEETLSCLTDAKERKATIVILAAGGKLIDIAKNDTLPFVELKKVPQPRYSVIEQLRAITKILATFGLATGNYDELATLTKPVGDFLATLTPDVLTEQNAAKQLATFCVGKTPIIYASTLFRSIAYKWKISFNENAKNTAWWDEFPEMNHNEFIGWNSHPIEKPFAVLDLRSNFDHPRIATRFALTEKLLSGRRPHAQEIWLHGDSILCQMVCGVILADFVSIYMALLNGVNPTPVDLVEKLKVELG